MLRNSGGKFSPLLVFRWFLINSCKYSVKIVIVASACFKYLECHFLLDLVAMEIGVEHHDGVGEHVHCVLVGKLLTKIITVGLLE